MVTDEDKAQRKGRRVVMEDDVEKI